jgi:DNA primase catalytic core
MARIPDDEIERIKAGVSVAGLAEARGIVLKHSADNLIGLCPFHADRTPSLVISASKNIWHCLGACQAGGSVIDWVMRAERVSFRHAVELLRSDSALAAAAAEQPLRKRLPAPLVLGADDQALLDQVIDYYHQCAQEGTEARTYLAKRGLDHPELIARFRIGFVDRTLGYRLPAKKLKARTELNTALQRTGILRDSGHEHFRGCLVLPILDEAGHVTEVYGRRVDHHLPTGVSPHSYLPGPHRGVWNLEAVQQYREIILCEALIDALTFWAHGFHNVTASYGVEGFTADHLAAFQRHGTERVLIAYDRDEAGDAAALKLAERLMAVGIECYRIQFPRGMDANQYALKLTPADKSLALVVRKAVWLGKGPAPVRTPEAMSETPAALSASASTPAPLLASPCPALVAAAIAGPAVPVPAPASPATMPPPIDVPVEVRDDEVTITLADRRYRVRGLSKNLAPELLKINLLVAQAEHYHVDTLDLYSARARGVYLAQAAQELSIPVDVLKHDIGRVLLTLEQLQAQQIKDRLAAKAETPAMSDTEQAEALALLQSPDLLDRIVDDLTACGLVGETTNKLTAYIAATSRLLDAPLAVVVRSSSAAGKSSLMQAVLSFMPADHCVRYSAMTGQALFYLGQTSLKHKILALAEEEGAHRAAYALKLLQSEGELTIASTGKDPTTGNLITQEYRVEGPVMLVTTTTAVDIDPELLNRCLVLTVDEGRSQTQAIHVAQRTRRTLEGLIAKDTREQLRTRHRNAQRLLRPLAVLNPFADRLTFPDATPRLRRDHEKYLSLIDTVALLHQYQRPHKSITRNGVDLEYIEVTRADIVRANQLAHEVLGRSLDELPPQTRSLLKRLCVHVTDEAHARAMRPADIRFSRRQVREALDLGDTQTKVHLGRLVELEYVIPHRTEAGVVYELVYDGQGKDGTPVMPGLIDADRLPAYESSRSGGSEAQAGGSRPGVGPESGAGRTSQNPANPSPAHHSADDGLESVESQDTAPRIQTATYGNALPLAARGH